MPGIYLDYAAATPIDRRVLEVMQPYFMEKFYNASAIYLAAKAVKKDLEGARATVARWLGARPAEIIFTAGATEANNLAITGIMRQFPDTEILVSAIEHDSVLAPAQLFNGKTIPVTEKGIVNVRALEKMITPKTTLISVMLVNNELGTLQPLKEIAVLIKNVRRNRLKDKNRLPLYLHTDAAQAANLFDLHVARLGVDLMSINGGKIYGPKQSGVLFIRSGIELQPLIVGGGQERNMRSGTENIAGAVGFATALDIAQKGRSQELERLTKLRTLFIRELNARVPQAVVNGSSKHQSPHLVHITLPDFDNERLMMELDERGVQCAVGSACSASNTEPSHVLTAIGLTNELARASLRLSFGRPTKEADICRSVKLLQELVAN